MGSVQCSLHQTEEQGLEENFQSDYKCNFYLLEMPFPPALRTFLNVPNKTSVFSFVFFFRLDDLEVIWVENAQLWL